MLLNARRAAMAGALVLAAMSGGCEPCAGLVNCSGSTRVALSGRLLDEATGRPVSGALVDLIWVGGVTLARDSIRTQTDDEGLFGFAVAASAAGDAIVDVSVRAPSTPGYRVQGLLLTATNRRGEGRVLPAWSTVPRLPDLAMIYRRGHPHQPLVDVEVEFRQTGGPPVVGFQNGVYRTRSNADGWLSLFGGDVRPMDASEIVGDLVIKAPAPIGETVHTGVRILPQTTFKGAAALRTFGAGPNLEYHFAVQDRGRPLVGVAGVRVEFRRTGGIAVTHDTWAETTDAFGRVVVPGYALERGTLFGDLRVVPPPPLRAYDLPNLALPTYEQDGAKIFAFLGVGPGLPYYLIIRNAGVPLAGVEVEFQRTGGIQISPERFTTVSNDSGMVFLTPDPEVEGEVIADITVRPPSPYQGFVVRGVRLLALDADRPGGRVLLGDWDLTAPPAPAPAP